MALYNIIKKINSSINIGGPGLYKGLSILDDMNNPLLRDRSFFHNWLNEAIDNNFGVAKDDMSILVCKFREKD